MRAVFVALWLLVPTGSLASQPISESLAECAAIYDHAAALMEKRRPENAVRLKRAGDAFYVAAIDTATAEGRSDPDRYAAIRYDEKAGKWRDLTMVAMATGTEFKEWTAYCRKLGTAKGLPAL